MLIKAGFSRRIEQGERIRSSRRRKGERGIWQRRFWEHLIRAGRDLARHVDYVHINPIKHAHVARAVKWPFSSIRRYIRRGNIHGDWACDPAVIEIPGDPVGRCWGSLITAATQAIGAQAQAQGFNAIRYFSERAIGEANYAILDNFNQILKPVIVTPAGP